MSARSVWGWRGAATAGSTPRFLPKGQTRLDGFNERIIARYARGLTTRDIQAHLRENLTGFDQPGHRRCAGGVAALAGRPLDLVFPVVFIDALVRHEALCDRVEVE